MSLTFDFYFICLFSFKKRPSSVPWRTLWVQPTLKAVKAQHGMNERWNKCRPSRNETRTCIRRLIFLLNRTCHNSSTETLDLLTCDSRTGSTNSCSFISLLKVASISVCDTSFRLSEVRQFGLSNSPSQKIKTNFRNGEKVCRSRENVVVFNANRKFNFYRTTARYYKVTQRRRRAKVVDS